MRRPDKHLGTVIEGYVLEELIGWGIGTKVYRGRHHLTGHLQAIKVINKSKSKIGVLHRSFPECSIMARLRHPNIVELSEWFETEKRLYLIMELARDGDLLSYLTKAQRPPSEEAVQCWFVQIVDALAFAHARGFVHGDLRLENILLDGNRVLLADWGSSQTFFAGVPSATFSEKSKSYAPPEVIAHRPYFPPQAECWSLGVTLYAMACGRLPFDRNSPTFATDVATGNFEMPPHVSIRLRSMIHGLLSVDPIIRFSMFDIQHHDFFCSAKLPSTSLTPTPSALHSRSSIAMPPAAAGPPMPHQVAARAGGALSAAQSGSSIGSVSDAARRRKGPAASMSSTRIHDLSDSPPRSSSFGSLVRLTREPPSPAQSEPSSRISSKRSSRNFEEEELEESKPKAAKMGEVTPPASPTTERKKKPLTRVLAFIKHLPAKVLG